MQICSGVGFSFLLKPANVHLDLCINTIFEETKDSRLLYIRFYEPFLLIILLRGLDSSTAEGKNISGASGHESSRSC